MDNATRNFKICSNAVEYTSQIFSSEGISIPEFIMML